MNELTDLTAVTARRGSADSGCSALMSVAEAAARLPVSRETIRRRLRSRVWPMAGRAGRRYLLPAPFVLGLAAAWASGSGIADGDFAAAWMNREAA
jgi:excisionase family DNA binding protein